MTFVLGPTSRKRLVGVHADLVRVVERALELCAIDFGVHEGVRTRETQVKYLAAGVSKTLNSRHLTGDAVDLYPSGVGDVFPRKGDSPAVRAEKLARFEAIAAAMFAAADELGVLIEWGGDWKEFVDMPHFQLPWPHHVGRARAAAVARKAQQ